MAELSCFNNRHPCCLCNTSTFKGGSFSTRSVISQTQAANQWAYYQAKSIKGYLYEIQKEALELEFQKLRLEAQRHLPTSMKRKLHSIRKR